LGIPWFASREDVALALERGVTVRTVAALDRSIAAATDTINGDLQWRNIYPHQATRTFDWPPDDTSTRAPSWRLWLGRDCLISVTSVSVGGSALTDYQLKPDNRIDEPARSVELLRSGSATFGTGAATPQRHVSIVGLWGWSDVSRSVGVLESAIGSSSTETVDLTSGAAVGVGNLVRVDDERMIVTDKTAIDTGQNTTGALTANLSDTSVGVATGSGFTVGEVIEIGSELMLVERISGNTLSVRRGWGGTTNTAHLTNQDVYAYRRLTVERGAAGTTATTHADAATVTRWVPPAALESLCIALAIDQALQEGAAYARTSGEGDNAREMRGTGVRTKWESARRYRRKGRVFAV
jgi:hypothetical protein